METVLLGSVPLLTTFFKSPLSILYPKSIALSFLLVEGREARYFDANASITFSSTFPTKKNSKSPALAKRSLYFL